MSRSPRSPDLEPFGARPDSEAFWAFAVVAWEHPDLREVLLRWQESYRVDVIFVLFVCWLSQALPAQRWAGLHTASGHWNQTVTRRIRALRRQIRKIEWPQGYEAILQLELASERVEATWLVSASRTTEGPTHTPDLNKRIERLFWNLPPMERIALIAAIHPLL